MEFNFKDAFERLISSEEYCAKHRSLVARDPTGTREAIKSILIRHEIESMQWQRNVLMYEVDRCMGIDRSLVRDIGIDQRCIHNTLPLGFINPFNPSAGTVQPAQPNQPKEKDIMDKFFETRAFVNGTDVTTLSNADLYSMIAKREAELKKFDSLENKPASLIKEQEAGRAEIAALVEYMNAKSAT